MLICPMVVEPSDREALAAEVSQWQHPLAVVLARQRQPAAAPVESKLVVAGAESGGQRGRRELSMLADLTVWTLLLHDLPTLLAVGRVGRFAEVQAQSLSAVCE